MNVDKLLEQLLRDEGIRLQPYRDTEGLLTIGIGRCLDRTGISREEALYLCRNDIERTVRELDEHVPWWRELDEPRQRVLVNMGFNLGVDGDPRNPADALTGFRATLALVRARRYAEAAAQMLRSKWARQVGPRAARLAEMMRTGMEPGGGST